jgi:hypothetical protein
MRNWDLREFLVQVNLPSPIWQVQVPIQHVLAPIRGLHNPIRQVVPQISHIRSYPPHCSRQYPHISLSCPQLYHHCKNKVKSSLSIAPCHENEITASRAYTEYKHTPRTSIHPRLFFFPSFS